MDMNDPLRWDAEIPDTPQTRQAFTRGYRIGLTRGALDAYYGRQQDAALPRWRRVDRWINDRMGFILAGFLIVAFVVILVAP